MAKSTANSYNWDEIDIEPLPALTIDDIKSIDTIDLSSLNVTMAGTGASGAVGSSGSSSFFYSSPSQYTFTTGATGSTGIYNGTSGSWITSSSHPSIKVNGDAEFDGDIKWRGRSLEKMLGKIESRLAILQDPDPEKLEKFAALKKAYEHYKTLERLIGDDYKDTEESGS